MRSLQIDWFQWPYEALLKLSLVAADMGATWAYLTTGFGRTLQASLYEPSNSHALRCDHLSYVSGRPNRLHRRWKSDASLPIGQLKHKQSAEISFEGSVATGYEIILLGAEDDTSKAVLAKLEASFGAGKPAKIYPDVTVYPAELGVSVQADKKRVNIRVGAGPKVETK